MGGSSKAQNAARQYDSCTLMVAMMGAAVMVMMAEATASVGTWTRDMRLPASMLMSAPIIT